MRKSVAFGLTAILIGSAAIRLSNATTRSPPKPGVMSEEVDAVSWFIFS